MALSKEEIAAYMAQQQTNYQGPYATAQPEAGAYREVTEDWLAQDKMRKMMEFTQQQIAQANPMNQAPDAAPSESATERLLVLVEKSLGRMDDIEIVLSHVVNPTPTNATSPTTGLGYNETSRLPLLETLMLRLLNRIEDVAETVKRL